MTIKITLKIQINDKLSVVKPGEADFFDMFETNHFQKKDPLADHTSILVLDISHHFSSDNVGHGRAVKGGIGLNIYHLLK